MSSVVSLDIEKMNSERNVRSVGTDILLTRIPLNQERT